ncbi:MAG: hypothetical protein RLY23_1084, partial [Actinomycetota bacterium]
MQLTERTAVITGAASGIGLALTKRLLEEGMSVVMADVEAETAWSLDTYASADAPPTIIFA